MKLLRDVPMQEYAKWGEFLQSPYHARFEIAPATKSNDSITTTILRNVQFSETSEACVDRAGNSYCLKIGKADVASGNLPSEPRQWKCPTNLFYWNSKPLKNFYHTMTDSLGILYSYIKIKEQFPSLRLLMHRGPHPDYVGELLGLLDIKPVYVSEAAEYNRVFTGCYLGLKSKRRRVIPRPELSDMYAMIADKTPYSTGDDFTLYLSRRTREHNNTRIGENNTGKRGLVNENQVVDLFDSHGFAEVFVEDYTLKEQLVLFSNAKAVAGTFGAGFVNTVFCPPGTKIISIGSATFKMNLAKRTNIYAGKLFADKRPVEINGCGTIVGNRRATNVPWKIDMGLLKQKLKGVL